jgi:hypothetical protein
MKPSQVSMLAILSLKKLEFTSLVKEIEMYTDELSSLETSYAPMFNDSVWMKLLEFNNMQLIAFFNVEKKKHIEKMDDVKKSLAYLKERKELKILEYDGLICMYRVL